LKKNSIIVVIETRADAIRKVMNLKENQLEFYTDGLVNDLGAELGL